MKASRKHLWLLLGGVLLLTLAVGCARGFKPGKASTPEPRSFRHKSHMDKEMECEFCHPGVYESGEEVIAFSFCLECHEPPEGAALDPKLADYVQADGTTGRWKVYSGVSDEINFDHDKHVEKAGLSCEECHGDIAEDDLTASANIGTKPSCLDCHKAKGSYTECSDCHKTVRSDQRPPSHTAAWTRTHGAEARSTGLRDFEGEGQCSLCHTKDTCTACHQEQAPRDHTAFWNRRGHGLAAQSGDRSRCATCHQQDFCVRCHETKVPANHVGSFRTGRQTHCLTCHGDTAVTTCATCHRAAIFNHAQGPRQRSDHTSSFTESTCRVCHGATAHSDNGAACTSCHLK